MHFLTNNLLWSQGQPLIALCLIGAIVGLLWWRPLIYLSLFFFLFCLHFFRYPQRVCVQAQQDQKVLVCPSDGVVVEIKYAKDATDLEGFVQRVSIYLSFFDVHVTWAPIQGAIRAVEYTPGSFFPSFLAKSSLLNEHNDVVINDMQGNTIKVRQIAGLLARRICCWVKPNQIIAQCDTIGMIRFGSRVDLFLPAHADLLVGVGQRVYGGQTAIARWRN